MKKSNLLLSLLAMFFGLSLVLSSQFVFGQDSKNEKEVKVKIVQNINGEKKTIEKSFSANDDEAIKELLKEFDVNIDEQELMDDKQVEISIRKTDAKSEDEDVVIKLERVIDDAHVEGSPKAFLGVILDDIESENPENTASSERHGVVIAKVLQESAAEKSGLKEGDLITGVNNTEITGSRQFQDLIRSLKPGDEVTIHYLREGKENSVKTALGEKMTPDFPMFRDEDIQWHGQVPPMMRFHCMEELKERPFLGVVPGAPSEDVTKQEGVVIGDVIEKSIAQEMGLKKGDVIVEINDKQVNNFDELREVVRSSKVGDELKVEWKRDGQAMKASAPVKSKAECKAICMEKGMIPHCGEMGKFQYRLDDKEMSKEVIEKTIEHLEREVQNLKQQLQQLEITGEAPDVKTEETRITITIEDAWKSDASKNTLDAESLLFSPNPSNGKFNLSFELAEKGKTEVRIFDASNKEIYSESLGKFSGRYDKQIDISDNPKGIYFLQITQNNEVLNKKIAIQ